MKPKDKRLHKVQMQSLMSDRDRLIDRMSKFKSGSLIHTELAKRLDTLYKNNPKLPKL